MGSIFKNNVEQLWQEAGIAWLKELPAITARLAKKWQLTDLKPAPNLSYNYILLGYQDAKPIALKVGFERNAIEQEKLALQVYNGQGCVKLLDACTEHNALLLEQLISGKSLKSFFPKQDDVAVEQMVAVMRQLHSVPVVEPEKFKHIQDWLNLLDTPPAEVVDHYHVKKARGLAKELLATQGASVLLHGDLHHDNILQSGDSWKAIDPKGIMGEPVYEVGAFIRNPYESLLKQENPRSIMFHRIKLCAELTGFNEQRLHAWAYVQAVLAGCWSIQDGFQKNIEIALAEAALLDESIKIASHI